MYVNVQVCACTLYVLYTLYNKFLDSQRTSAIWWIIRWLLWWCSLQISPSILEKSSSSAGYSILRWCGSVQSTGIQGQKAQTWLVVFPLMFICSCNYALISGHFLCLVWLCAPPWTFLCITLGDGIMLICVIFSPLLLHTWKHFSYVPLKTKVYSTTCYYQVISSSSLWCRLHT